MKKLSVLLILIILTLTGCKQEDVPSISVVSVPYYEYIEIHFSDSFDHGLNLNRIEVYESTIFKDDYTFDSYVDKVVFTQLLSNTTYKFLIQYMDEDGNEYQVEETVKTKEYFQPYIYFDNITQIVGDISFDVIYEDPFQMMTIDEVFVLSEEGIKTELLKDLSHYELNNLKINQQYYIQINYQYDLNDGRGVRKRSYQTYAYAYDKTITLFNELALRTSIQEGFQIIKWDQDIKIHITGNPSDALIDETEKIADELTTLMNGISVSVVNTESEANVHLYFGNQAYFQTLLPKATGFQPDIWGHAVVYTNDDYIIDQGYILVNMTDLPNEEEAKSTLRHELMHIVGCFGHTGWDKESSLYIGEPVPPTLEFSETDKQIIQLLYMDRIVVGMHQQTVDNILLEELY